MTGLNHFNDGDEIEYEYMGVTGDGVVRGIASVEVAVIGATYIIENKTPNFIPSETYPYNFFALPAVFLTLKNV